MECGACEDLGFILADNNGKIEIERCDSCNSQVSDDKATEAVYLLAQAALDLKDVLVLYYGGGEENDFSKHIRKVGDAFKILHGTEDAPSAPDALPQTDSARLLERLDVVAGGECSCTPAQETGDDPTVCPACTASKRLNSIAAELSDAYREIQDVPAVGCK